MLTVNKYQAVYVPDYLLTDCKKTQWSGGTLRDIAALARARGTDVDNCNAQLQAIRVFQAADRVGQP